MASLKNNKLVFANGSNPFVIYPIQNTSPDCNAWIDPGIYFSTSGNVANAPVNDAIQILVLPTDTMQGWCKQILFVLDSTDIYTRNRRNASAWTNWTKIH